MKTTGVLLYFLVICVVNVKTSLIATKVDLCGPIMELVLDQFDESSATIALASNEYMAICKLKIVAPKSHVIYLSVTETATSEQSVSEIGTCPLNVYQNENSDPAWSGDPCSNQPVSDIDLLNPEVTLEWSPPTDTSHSKGKKLLVTAVGRGNVCKDSMQHTCMSVGHEPLFCISKYLLCDGNRNCPRGATRNDEDDKLCKITWSIFFKQFKNPEVNDKILNLLLSKTTKSPGSRPIWQDWTNIQRSEVTTIEPITSTESSTSNIESLSAALSHYGPWGYILLGMLICGTVLMFCGVWECFRKPKPPSETPQNSPTTVLIINQSDETSPPRYDDIDPPSYSTLFPNVKVIDPLQATDTIPGVSQTNTIGQPEEFVSNENQGDSVSVEEGASVAQITNISSVEQNEIGTCSVSASTDDSDNACAITISNTNVNSAINDCKSYNNRAVEPEV